MENKVREIYKDDFTEYLLCLALDVGEGMLKNGGEVARVENTIERICRAYGALHVEVFTIISVINAAIRMPDGSYSSQLRRVKQTTNNLNTLENLNELSRRICRTTPSLDEFDSMLHELKRAEPYSLITHILASSMGACSFCLFFGGGIIDSVVTFVIGALVSLILSYRSLRLNSMAKTVAASFAATTLAGILHVIIPFLNVDSIIIGVIMLLVPGLMFGTAMRDLLCGDLIAGTLKILQAFIQTLMIGLGYMLSYALIGERLIINSADGAFNFVAVEIVSALVSSVVFAIVFKSNKRHLWFAGLCGLITYSIYFATLSLDMGLFWAAFLSSAAATVFSEAGARIRKMPAIVILMPGVISIVPGGYLYRFVRAFIIGDTPLALSELGMAGEIGLGIAGGIVVFSVIFSIVHDNIIKSLIK